MRQSILFRLLSLTLLPLILVFALLAYIINGLVYDQGVTFANERATALETETINKIGDELANIMTVLELMSNSLSAISPGTHGAQTRASDLARSMLDSVPDVHAVWFAFQPGLFTTDGWFAKLFVEGDGEILEQEGFDQTDFDNSDVAPWFYFPYRTGHEWLVSADFYNYGMGMGYQFTDTVSIPLIRDGETVGVVGIDILYENTFQFLDSRQIENELLMLLVLEDGQIVYASDRNYLAKSIFDLPMEQSEMVGENLLKGRAFDFVGQSPFFRTRSHIYFNPIYEISKGEVFDYISVRSDGFHSPSYSTGGSRQLFLYIDYSTDALFAQADAVTRMIIFISILSLAGLATILFLTMRNILKPIKKLTEDANQISQGNLSVDLSLEQNAFDEKMKSKSNNEIRTLFLALQKMLNQLNQAQHLRVDALEAQHEKEKAEAADKAKSSFLARMSHEIRTPMNAISGMAELALREEISPAAREQVFTIKQASANLLSIINDILDFSKIETGKLEILPEYYMFSSMINDVISIIRMRVLDTQIRFVVNFDSDIPNELYGDEIRIRQILLNLLNNAVKYTEHGYVSLCVFGERSSEDEFTLSIEVEDSGKGIREKDLESLFGDFVQLDMEHNKGVEGTGLGLAITKNLVNNMGGEILVESEYGYGSTFTTKIPQKCRTKEPLATIKEPEIKSVLIYELRRIYANSLVCTVDNLGVRCAMVTTDVQLRIKLASKEFGYVFVPPFLLQHVQKACEETKSGVKIILLTEFGDELNRQYQNIISMPAHAISIANILNGEMDSFMYGGKEGEIVSFIAPKAKILVVDDINTNLKIAEGLLLPYKIQTTLCKSGKDALKAIESQDYDAVFMDHMMPEMDGIETTAHIRELGGQNTYYKNVPIIALTANAVADAQAMFRQSGFNDFLAKPINTIKLNVILERWIPKEKQEKITQTQEEYGLQKEQEIQIMVIPGVDIQQGILMSGGMAKRYLQTLKIFRQDGFEKMDEIRKSLETDNLPLYVTHVHALKSASANIGAKGISESARLLEAAGREEDLPYIQTNNPRFVADLRMLLGNIETALPVEEPELTKEEMNYDELKGTMLKLKTALDGFDALAIDEATVALQPYVKLQELGGTIDEILQNTLVGEYEEAVGKINTILGDGKWSE